MVIRNNSAGWLWIGALMLAVLLGVMTFGLIRDGGSKTFALAVVVPVTSLLWLACAALLLHVAGKACWQVARLPDGAVEVAWRYPFRVRTRCYPLADLSPAQLVESRDSEGIPYFHVRLILPDGEVIDLAEGRRRTACLSVCRRFNSQLSADGTAPATA